MNPPRRAQPAMMIVGMLLVVVVASAAGTVQAAPEAGTRLPLEHLSADHRVLVEGVTSDVTLQRAYPPRRFAGQSVHFEYLLDHMLVTSVIAEHLGLIRYRVTRDNEGRYWADDREGAQGFLLPAHAEDGMRLFYVAGARRGVFEARGRGVATVHYRQAGPGQLEYNGAAFIKVDNRLLEILTEVFRVFLKGVVDEHFQHILRQPIALTELASHAPQDLHDRLLELPEADRQLVESFRRMLPHEGGNPLAGP